MKYPKSPRRVETEVLFGNKVSDGYRWLEDTKAAEVNKWVEAQNELADQVIKDKTPYNLFRESISKTFNVTDYGTPVKFGKYYFWMERQPGEDQFVLYASEQLGHKPKELINPNGRKEGNTVTIDFWVPSRDGKFLAYGLSEDGNEMATLYVMDVEKVENLPDEVLHAPYSIVCWLHDGSGFYYTRCPRPGDVPKNEERLHSKLYLHNLGDAPENDKLIFGKNRPKDDYYEGLTLTEDDRYLYISVAQGWMKNDVFVHDSTTGDAKSLSQDIEAVFRPIVAGDKLIIYTNYRADNYRMVCTDAHSPSTNPDDWHELIPEKESLLEFFGISKNLILAVYLEDCANTGKVFDHTGKDIMDMPLPQFCSLAGMSAHPDESEFFIGTVTYVAPKVIYRYEPAKSTFKKCLDTKTQFDPKNYVVKQEWTKSNDGTKLPLFVIHKKGLKPNGKNPVILTGYGGFGSSVGPNYLKMAMPWLNAGGIMSVAILRGGEEYGKQWHRDGILDKKQNTFDDFIAIAEHLISARYTSPPYLAIHGASNGGLLVGAAMAQRPELFKAVICDVPLLDMVRFPRFLIASRWVREYGDPGKADDLKRILKWSPYHNIRKDVEYPAVLFSTAVNDTRVHPSHAWKMAARMQSLRNKNPVLVKTETEAGHTSSATPVKKMVDAYAAKVAFVAWQTGLALD